MFCSRRPKKGARAHCRSRRRRSERAHGTPQQARARAHGTPQQARERAHGTPQQARERASAETARSRERSQTHDRRALNNTSARCFCWSARAPCCGRHHAVFGRAGRPLQPCVRTARGSAPRCQARQGALARGARLPASCRSGNSADRPGQGMTRARARGRVPPGQAGRVLQQRDECGNSAKRARAGCLCHPVGMRRRQQQLHRDARHHSRLQVCVRTVWAGRTSTAVAWRAWTPRR